MTDSEMNKMSVDSKTILVVDDDELTTRFLNMLLTKEGFNTLIAKNGIEALDYLKSASPKVDLIILDLMMPQRGGYEILKDLQETEHKNIPVFIITARTMDKETIDMFRSEPNVSDYWTKPIDLVKLKDRVHEVLGTTPK